MGCGTAFAQSQGSLSGTVTDANGEPLAGVFVLVTGTSNGIATDHNGYYELKNIKTGENVEFSFIGMVTVNYVYDGKKAVYNVSMQDDI